MTKKRDSYKSAFDKNEPGASAASYDLMLVIWMIEKYLKDQELLRERVSMGNRGSWTLAQLLEIAHDAQNSSIDPVLQIYKRLQRNEAAAAIAAEATNSPRWKSTCYDLFLTLQDRELLPRRYVTQYRKEVAARHAKESKESEARG